ncbi:HAMP domain-containing protein [Noviherbaspirillum cavernae]|uniref:HAMP domain-containing protein n=1 Tax=Noviherbaspirillum cavernae TaxID=2320862 RepID=A0A418X0V1_9BURK|nr:methyl-accepting chemotaxis protein [Noviherbaspirillum cavernae]RJG05945.1 HAMP domain-containing protein [Noviherbaspirillum cavernae]
MSLNDIKVSRKLWATIVVLLAAMLAVSFFTSRYSRHVQEEAMTQVERHDNLITVATKWKAMAETNSLRAVAAGLSADQVATDFFNAELKKGIAESSGIQKYLVENANTAEDKKAMDEIGKARTHILAVTKKLMDAKATGDAEALKKVLDSELMPATDVYVGAMGNFVKLQETQRDDTKARSEEARNMASTIGLVSAALVFALGMGCAAVLVRSINQPLAHAVRVAEGIAAGDLTQRIDDSRRDEFGQLMRAMRRMNESLAGVVGNVLASTESIGTASSEIATGNLDLSARTEQTASNLQQTAASMEQITESVRHNADAANQANQLTSAASDAATRGGKVVSEVVDTMQAITASSQKIADIIGVIDGIAFQTNILALNAAVEAARAGEQGRGFAVVASEVRNLAQRSAQAAKEIKSLIDTSTEKVEAGAELVQTAGATMEEIVASVRRVTDIMHEITAATTEQSTGINEVNKAVGNLDQMTQQNAALVEEAAAAATSMQEQARHLADTVSTFKVNDAQRTGIIPAGSVARVAQAPRARTPAVAVSRKPVPAKPAAIKASSPKQLAAATGSNDDWEEF